MTVYLWSLTALNALFLLHMQVVHWTELKTHYDRVQHMRKAGKVCLVVLGFTADFFRDVAKYVLIALLISLISLVVYVWALVRPEQWKSYSMLMLGIGFTWIGGELTPEALASGSFGSMSSIAKFFADDRHGIVLTTVLVIGHVYIITSMAQILFMARRERLDKERSEHEFQLSLRTTETVVETVARGNAHVRRLVESLPPEFKEPFIMICNFRLKDGMASREQADAIERVIADMQSAQKRAAMSQAQ